MSFVKSPDDGHTFVGRNVSRVWGINERQNIYGFVLVGLRTEEVILRVFCKICLTKEKNNTEQTAE